MIAGIEPAYAAWDNHLHPVGNNKNVADDVLAAVLPLDDALVCLIRSYPINISFMRKLYV